MEKKSYLISHNFNNYSINQLIDEYLSINCLEYELSAKDSRQMEESDICYIYFSSIPNDDNSRILLSGHIKEKSNGTIKISIDKFANSLELTGKKLIALKGKKIDFRNKQEIPENVASYVAKQFEEKSQSFDVKLLLDNLNINPNEGYHESTKEKVDQAKVDKLNKRKPMRLENDNTSVGFYTSRTVKNTALKKANFLCEIDNKHKSFLTKEEISYVEGHHMLPMSAQKDLSINIDHVDNIICLCPNCHREIHYGKDNTKIIKEIYSKVSKRGFFIDNNITLNEVLKYYKQ